MESAVERTVSIHSLDPSGPALLQVGGVALAGGAIGFSLALLETWLGKRGEDAEMQRSGRKRRRRTCADSACDVGSDGEKG